MIRGETRGLRRHYLVEGIVYRWIAAGEPDSELDEGRRCFV